MERRQLNVLKKVMERNHETCARERERRDDGRGTARESVWRTHVGGFVVGGQVHTRRCGDCDVRASEFPEKKRSFSEIFSGSVRQHASANPLWILNRI